MLEDKKIAEPTISAIQHDVALAYTHRLELVKIIMTISAGLFAFTVSFPVSPNIPSAKYVWFTWISWIGLGGGMLFGIMHLKAIEQYFISYKDFDWKEKRIGAGASRRTKIEKFKTLFSFCQYGGFAIGVISTAALADRNLTY